MRLLPSLRLLLPSTHPGLQEPLPQCFHPIHTNLLQTPVSTYFRLPKVPHPLLHFLATLKTWGFFY